MYAELTPDARRRSISLEQFQRSLRRTRRATATIADAQRRRGRPSDGRRRGRPGARSRPTSSASSAASSRCRSPTTRSPGRRNLVYPGLAADERLSRRTRAPERARDPGRRPHPAGRGPGRGAHASAPRRSPSSARSARRAARRRSELAARRLPARDADRDLGARARLQRAALGAARAASCSRSAPTRRARSAAGGCSPPASRCAARPVRTNIDPELQETRGRARSAASTAASPCSTPARARCSALAGLAYSAPQPPGSTFKMITATGALDAGIVKPSDEFPVEIVELRDRPRDPQRPRRALRRHLRRDASPTRATRSSPRSAPSSAARSWSRPPSCSASTRRRTLFDPQATGDRSTRPQSTIPDRPLRERRDRRVGDRPGPGAGDAAGDGERRRRRSPTSGVRLPTPIARSRRARSPTASRSR